MTVTELALPGVKLIETTYFDDNRGNSTEAYNDRTLKEYEIDTRFVVDYQCYNADAGTIRGIHFQNNPHPQVKLVRVVQGAVMDYIVDLRRDMPGDLCGEPEAAVHPQRLRPRLCDAGAWYVSAV